MQRTCREMGIQTVMVYSEADVSAKYVRLADEAVCIGPPSAEKSYMNAAAIIAAAEITESQAIHPGYGFFVRKRPTLPRKWKKAALFLSAPGRKQYA